MLQKPSNHFTADNLLMIPDLIEFAKLGDESIGFLTVVEDPQLPFKVERVYWTYSVPDNMVRGHHAHHDLEQLIFAVSGKIEFELENLSGEKKVFVLDSPNIGLYIPKLHWRTIVFSDQAVLVCLASMKYDEIDYIRDYSVFNALKS